MPRRLKTTCDVVDVSHIGKGPVGFLLQRDKISSCSWLILSLVVDDNIFDYELFSIIFGLFLWSRPMEKTLKRIINTEVNDQINVYLIKLFG